MTTPTEQPRLNLPLLRKVREQIENHPENFDMTYWRRTEEVPLRPTVQGPWETKCQTTFCVGGWACELSGLRWEGAREALPAFVDLDGQLMPPAAAAEKLLGLLPYQAEALFYTNEDEAKAQLDDLIAQAEEQERRDALL